MAEHGAPTRMEDQHALDALVHGRNADPFSYLGPHETQEGLVVRAFFPGAKQVDVRARATGEKLAELSCIHGAGVFSGLVSSEAAYRFHIVWPEAVQEVEDPYSFGLLLDEDDLKLFSAGTHPDLSSCLGAHAIEIDGVRGVRFAVWAPNAKRVSVVGHFNVWDGRRHPMRLRHAAGVWELFIPGLEAGERYKYEIVGPDRSILPLKADPFARRTEVPPATASVVAEETPFRWADGAWLRGRESRQGIGAPLSIYEVHAGSWFRDADNATPDWDALAERLVPYVSRMGFTHVEFMPVMEHPFGGSWGYQPLGQYAPTARHGEPAGFARLVDRCHEAGIGVILDWVPGHFPNDAHGLYRFDGTALYEHEDPREGFHPDWHSMIYNFGRQEVCNFLIDSALYWIEKFHVDGLRVDAVASMLYRDYSRKAGEWIPNIHGGRENLESIALLRRLNETIRARCPGVIVLAEESTAWPGVTREVAEGGLGFAYKWNMGWMHDTLRYMEEDPIHRRYHHSDMTFGMIYAFSERFVLPLSHDEVVHGKGSLLSKMPGDRWQQFANLRAYFGFMWAHPGKKLLFMGGEIGQRHEWNHDRGIEWSLIDDPMHAGLQRLVRDLNTLYARDPALHARDSEPEGFSWLVSDDGENSVLAFERRAPGAPFVVAISNMTPVPRYGYRIGVPEGGLWSERLNSDADIYGGSNVGNSGLVETDDIPSHGRADSLSLTLPPLATIILRRGTGE
ncbi:MAG: 1,4-alpha-glucan branching protein GlgB [Parvibaculum sp.]|uniref:1,4-alpha-glucan branching protein GlgB n=1 Tax=Parvibaculum sp. TaxID=2024848 RepID=UPI0025D2D1BD|nr:1,4-alpha-glucan branching protein GlgB [Parvibaculum sp.]MCE9649793.1 1,4-alpha-glucan branching protein GlgB [Parvibaculum sp.]